MSGGAAVVSASAAILAERQSSSSSSSSKQFNEETVVPYSCSSSDEEAEVELKKVLDVPFDEAVKKVEALQSVSDRHAAELAVFKQKEEAVFELCTIYVSSCRKDDFRSLFLSLKSLFLYFPKARMAKIARVLIDQVAALGPDLQTELCLNCIEWCVKEKRTFLRHRMQTKLASLYCQKGMYQQGLSLIPQVIREVKKLDEKILLVELYTIEAKLCFFVKRIARSKAALVSARTNANAIHCPPQLQAEIDIMSGALHAEEEDFATAYSYFFEAYESLTSALSQNQSQNQTRNQAQKQNVNLESSSSSTSSNSLKALKYMLLCSVMTDGSSEEMAKIERKEAGKDTLELPEIKCFLEIGRAYKARSLHTFEQLWVQYGDLMKEDPIISSHTEALAQKLVGKSILQFIEPYSKIEISEIARMAKISEQRIEAKLAEMILDNELAGTLDQSNGTLIVFDKGAQLSIYDDCVSVIEIQHKVVETLVQKASKLQ